MSPKYGGTIRNAIPMAIEGFGALGLESMPVRGGAGIEFTEAMSPLGRTLQGGRSWQDFLEAANLRVQRSAAQFPTGGSQFTMSTGGTHWPTGPISMETGLDLAAQHLGGAPTNTVISGSGGVQFMREVYLPNGTRITSIARFDINPSSMHVQTLGEHLNLETQINGVTVKTGPLADPHIRIDPSTIKAGDY